MKSRREMIESAFADLFQSSQPLKARRFVAVVLFGLAGSIFAIVCCAR